MMSDWCIAEIVFYFAVKFCFLVVCNAVEYLTSVGSRFCTDDIVHISFVSEFAISFDPDDFRASVCCNMDLCQAATVRFRFDHGLDILMPLVPLDQQKR